MKLHTDDEQRFWRKATTDQILRIRQMSQKTEKYNKSKLQVGLFADGKSSCNKFSRIVLFGYLTL
jgi:hypothetical protein